MNRASYAFVFLLLLASSQVVDAYELGTHGEIAQRAAEPPIALIDEVLKRELQIIDGVTQKFLGKTAQLWIREGAESEDIPFLRSLHHFHNPLLPWEDAGLRTFLSIINGQSSVLWQQNSVQDGVAGGGNWSWQNARERYLAALTGATTTERERAFADMFRTLGQLTHLVQDASVPAHVRNDPHLPLLNPDGYEQWVERTRARGETRALFTSLLNQAPLRPPLSLFTPTGRQDAPVPIARLIDTDVFLELNAGVLTNLDLGVAEYTNGNFLSRDTIFKGFPLPSRESLDAGFFEPEGAKLRRYFRKTGQGELVDHFVAEGMLYESLRAEVGSPPAGGWVLTRKVHEDYARLLLPRAVGYSAALLDYFFRGKLDVDLVEDPVEPSVLRLVGSNASPDALVDGTLTLYADDPNGVRSVALALDPTTIASVAPGQLIPSARFQVPETAERFVAVYQGTLGQEVKDPERGFPGGVIGKVLGGVRVEEIFSDGSRWFLRTPQDVFPLPLLKSEVDELKWGDADNTLVGRSLFGPGQPNQFSAYEIARPLGSSAVPLMIQADGSPVVDLRLRRQVSFPFGMDLGTTIQFTQTIDYQQYLLSFVLTTIWKFETFGYNFVANELSDGRVDLMVNEHRSLTRSYSITLDPAKLSTRSGSPYAWQLQQTGLTAEGRILALVAVRLTSPGEATTFPAFTLEVERTEVRNDDGTLPPQVVATNPVTLPFSFPPGMGPAFWALVDVGEGRVVASTAPPMLTLNYHLAHTNLHPTLRPVAARMFRKERFIGGHLDGAYRYAFPAQVDLLRQSCSPDRLSQMVELGTASIQRGVRDAAITQYRPEIASHQFPPRIERAQSIERYPFVCETVEGPAQGFTVAVNESNLAPSRIDQVLRPTPGSSAELLVLLAALDQGTDASTGEFGDAARLMIWIPEHGTAELRHEFPRPGFYSLWTASPRAALTISEMFSDSGETSATTLTALQGEPRSTVFPDIKLFDFVLLEPTYLYNVSDLKFYRLQPPLQRTALPTKLADIPGNPVGDYHVIRLP